MPELRVPRGILNEPLARAKFDLTLHEPATALRPYVQHHWIVQWNLSGERPHEQRVLPNASVHATFAPGATGIYGPSRAVFQYVLADAGQALGVRFRPGCFRPFLRKSVTHLGGISIPLADCFGPGATETELAIRNASKSREMVSAAETLLLANLPPSPLSSGRVAAAVDTLAADPEITRVDQLSATVGISVRSLQRLFHEYVGCSPKWVIRVYRFNDAARRLTRTQRPDFATLADELGYSDQAHFTRDFAAVVGTSPAQYLREFE